MQIVDGRLDHPHVIALLSLHLDHMRENSPPGSVHALDLAALKRPEITFLTVWGGNALLGCGALKALDGAGEIKSMRTHPAHLRQGVAAALLDHIIAMASARHYRRISLETGSGKAFDPALALYRRYGFLRGEAFADYRETEFNRFYHLALARVLP